MSDASKQSEWLPREYQDEVVPETRPSPSAWLVKTSTGAWAIDDGDPVEGVDAGWTLTEGEVVLFDYRIDLAKGDLIVEHDEDGSRTWHTTFDSSITAPAGTHLIVWAYDVGGDMWSDLDEAASDLGAGKHAVAVYAWSDPSLAYRFTAGRLEPVRQDA